MCRTNSAVTIRHIFTVGEHESVHLRMATYYWPNETYAGRLNSYAAISLRLGLETYHSHHGNIIADYELILQQTNACDLCEIIRS